MLLALLGFIAAVLTYGMFQSRQMMLGFPCAIFWALFGAQAYTLSAAPWSDVYFYLFFTSMFGMTIFCALAAYGLRERKDVEADEGELIDEQPGETYFDEQPGEFFDEVGSGSRVNRSTTVEDRDTPKRRVESRKAQIRQRIGSKVKKEDWGEFR